MMLMDVGRQVGGQLGELFQAISESPEAQAAVDTVAQDMVTKGGLKLPPQALGGS